MSIGSGFLCGHLRINGLRRMQQSGSGHNVNLHSGPTPVSNLAVSLASQARAGMWFTA